MTLFPPDGEALDEAAFWEQFGTEETGDLDFKERMPRASRFQEPLAAFANSRGGRVVMGVTDRRPRSVVGVTWNQELDEAIHEAARAVQPPLAPTIHRFTVGGREVVVVEVRAIERDWVHTSDGRVLVRAGPTNRALVGAELARFIRERSAEPVEDSVVPGATLESLHVDRVRAFLRTRLGRQRVQLPTDGRDVGLLDPSGGVRLATDLCFGRRPQASNRRFGIVIARFEGLAGGGARLRERSELQGTLAELVEQADRRVYDELRRDAVVRGLVREEIPEFPPVAIREALVNAVGHRDYSLRGASVEVRLYDDAIEIESPGSLPGYVTVENLRSAQYSRNERVMDVLNRLGLVEEAGQGIDRMIAEMEDALLDPPEFEELDAAFLVRLRGRSLFAAEDRLWALSFRDLGLSADSRVALVYARRNGAITNEELRSLRHVDRDTSRVILQDLVARGLMVAFGRGRGSRYRLADAANRPRTPTIDEQGDAVVRFARRNGSVVNGDVRGLLGIDAAAARALLERLVASGFLSPVGERRGRRYLPNDLPMVPRTSGPPS